MSTQERKGMGPLELGAIAVVAVFAVVVLFWAFAFIAGAVWWLVKILVLILVLIVVVRWAFRRASRSS